MKPECEKFSKTLWDISKQSADDAVLVEVIPEVGGSYYGSVNQPLQDKSEIRSISFNTHHAVSIVNDAYWRSCSFVTAAILKDALSAEIEFRFPKDSVHNSFFSVRVNGLDGKFFTPDELSTINRFAKNFIREDKDLEVISVPKSIAEENGISEGSLLRIGHHVFSSDGPVIRSTAQIGRFSIFRSRPIGKSDLLVGGVSLPHSLKTSSYSWSLIAKNAIQKFNQAV
uniref:Uncharacterized protein n=1 Tax=Caenorhabditis japonica TaxID=281687 RepID=A0A8R1I0U0_CAEJA